MFEHFEHGTYRDGEVPISYAAGGKGPPVLLLHGFPQTKALWARVAPLLARDFTVIAADLRGYGDSGKPTAAADSANYSFRSMAGDQLGLMQSLGFSHFHLVGHDRGGRTGHRLALDHPGALRSLAVLDIVPTYAMLMDTNRQVAGAYWHWYFLAQPAPFPERLIAPDPDYFFETCLVGWGKTRISDFDARMLAEYRRCWRQPGTIAGMINDYRAAAGVDLAHDTTDIDRRVECPALALWGSQGVMHRLFDMKAEWKKRCSRLETATLPGGHFFVDQLPDETARVLSDFLKRH